jgi:acylphosphatase
MTSQLEGLHAIVRGHVQGVYFRSATQETAERLGLTGWVRNRAEGTVEVEAEGPRAALDELVRFLHRGPPGARVSAVEIKWLPHTGQLSEFDVRW